MALFQGADNIFWFWCATGMTVLTALAIWYAVIIGRDRSPRKQRRGEETVVRYGTIEEDRAPVPKFMLWTWVGIAVWAIAYAVWTGIEGLGV